MNQSLCYGDRTNKHSLFKSLILLIILFIEIPFNTKAQNTSYSLKFDGIDDYIQLSENLPIGTSSNTIEFWVKVPETGTNNLIAGERVGILLGNFDDDPNSGWEIHDDGQMRLWWNDEELDVFGTTDLRDNEWHHIAFVRDKGNTILFYVDGMNESLSYQDGSGSGSDIAFTTTHRIGADNRSSGIPYFHGQINEVRIWNTALSQTQIQNNMSVKLSGSESNLIAHYKMDEASGTTLTDNSGSNTGTLMNGVTWFNNPPEIEGNDTSPTYREGDSDIQLFPALTISDVENDNIDGMKIYFSSGYHPDEDTLKFTDTPNITGSFNEGTGVLTLSGVASPAAYQTAVRSITYYNTYSDDAGKSATEGQREMGISIGGSAYSFETGHYYEFVAANLTWSNAKSAAESRYLYGMQGYLATITSQEENDFIQEKLAADGWLGGSDRASDDVWKWETGPETGTQFWQGEENGNATGGNYANWNSGEPNESGGSEDYLQIYSSGSYPGKWNDEKSTLQLGYVVEYGGMTDEGDVNLYTSTTLDVLTNTPPVANDTAYSRYYTITNIPYSVDAPGILGNDKDGEDDVLTAELVNNVDNGNLNFNTDGSFTFTPPNGWTGTAQFTYRAYDGIAYSNTATVTISVVVPRFTGGGTDDDFSNTDNWNTGYVPPESLDIIIASGQKMVVDQDYTCKNLQFELGSSFNCTGGSVLTITEGVLDANGNIAIDVASSFEVSSSIEIAQP